LALHLSDCGSACAGEAMPNHPGFRALLVSLWFQLVSLGIVGLVFAESLLLAPGKVQGWTFYLTTWEVLFEVLIRAVFAALVGIVLGTTFTVLISPILWYFKSARPRVLRWVTNAFVVLVLFIDTRFALSALIKWSQRGLRFTTALLILHFLAFVVALCLPRVRRELLASLEGFASEKGSRRTVAAMLAIMIALVATEYAFAHATSTVRAAQVAQRPKSNVLLVTFDALSAEDMSLYGYKLPTTPNLDAFAHRSTVFTNFYSVTTFTTPSIATMLTGGYPSDTRVFQLQGRVQGGEEKKNLAQLMRNAGYATGAFFSNPFAYYLADNPGNEFEVFPEPSFQAGGLQRLWDLTSPLHQTSGIGSRVAEYQDLESAWNYWCRLPGNLAMRFRPDVSFQHANQVLKQLPDGFFVWVHVITPHHPYLPDPEDRGRFLPSAEGRSFEENSELQWVPHYGTDQQGQVDRRRLLYDEFVLSADRAFGAFIAELEESGKLNNTTVIVSADHGESFEGGVFRHESPYLTKPTVHIPLIIHTPGQQQGRTVAFTADQTALSPTILDLAGQPKADWMQGQSLMPWLRRDNSGAGEGLAFAQFLEKNSIFKPLTHGTVGVIDGQYQYVLDLDAKKGALRPLSEAQIWDIDSTAENPAKAAELLAAIYARFPELRRESK
jgi:arylsulfatase A-like enzyme